MSRPWAPSPLSRGRSLINRCFGTGTLLVLCAFLLSSCGFSFGDSKPSETKSSAPALSTPPVAGERPGPANAMANMQPALGVNTNLFGEKLRGDDDRLDRLEGAVQNLRNDFDSMAPAITRLVTVEGDLQQLITQLETLLEEESAPPPQRPAPAAPVQAPAPMQQGPAPQATTPPTQLEPMAQRPQPVIEPAPTPAPQMAGQNVIGIRVGEHPDKTRIVLDATGKPSFTYDLDNNEKIFIVELPGTGWSATAQKSFSSSPLLASYRTDSLNGNGTRLIVQLKKSASVTYSSKLDGTKPGQARIVIDLSPDNSAMATQ